MNHVIKLSMDITYNDDRLLQRHHVRLLLFTPLRSRVLTEHSRRILNKFNQLGSAYRALVNKVLPHNSQVRNIWLALKMLRRL